MDRIKIIKRFDEPLNFSVSALNKEARLYISLVDSIADDVLFHVEFDKEAGKVSVKDRYSGVWSKPVLYDFEFKGQAIKGKIVLKDGQFSLELKELRVDFACKIVPETILWGIYSDFRYITLGDDEPVTAAAARRWRFFPEHTLRIGPGPRLRALGNHESRKPGLTALYLWDGDERALSRLVGEIQFQADEILVVVHNSSLFRHSYFAGLQSRFFNLRTVIVETTIKSTGEQRKLKGALFLNKVLSEVRYRNVIFLDSDTSSQRLGQIVHRHRLRSREDDFILRDEDLPHRLQAFSLGRLTHFVEASGRLHLPPEDLAHRHPITVRGAAPEASLEWDIGEIRLQDHPVVALDRQKKIKTPRRGKLAILVISCKKNRHKQQAIRDTWGKDAKLANIDICFIEGHPEHEQAILVEDRLLVPTSDIYEYLSHKVWHAMASALRIFDADHFLKIDDDCLVNIPALLEFAYERYDYIGSDINLGNRTAFDWHHVAVTNKQLADLIFEIDPQQTWYDGQGGYFLSRKAANLLAGTPLGEYQHILEDYATGRLMAEKGLEASRLNSKFLSIREIYIKSDRDYEHAVISDVTSVERTFEIYDIISKLNRQTIETKGRWRFEFPE